uniref:Uncharacterized protein n=1 Tax=Arundo donax TaxID=35708 RepID=A0A0A9EZT6_ARUDO
MLGTKLVLKQSRFKGFRKMVIMWSR